MSMAPHQLVDAYGPQVREEPDSNEPSCVGAYRRQRCRHPLHQSLRQASAAHITHQPAHQTTLNLSSPSISTRRSTFKKLNPVHWTMCRWSLMTSLPLRWRCGWPPMLLFPSSVQEVQTPASTWAVTHACTQGTQPSSRRHVSLPVSHPPESSTGVRGRQSWSPGWHVSMRCTGFTR